MPKLPKHTKEELFTGYWESVEAENLQLSRSNNIIKLSVLTVRAIARAAFEAGIQAAKFSK